MFFFEGVLSGVGVAYPRLAESDTGASMAYALALVAIGLIGILVFLGSAVAFSVWVRRANLNARVLGADIMEFSAGSCIWWFFVPIANLFKPYQAVKEIYRRSLSDSTDHWTVPRQFPLWWACWIIGNMLSQLETRLISNESPATAQIGHGLGVIAALIMIGAAIGAILVVQLIHQRQEQKSTEAVSEVFT